MRFVLAVGMGSAMLGLAVGPAAASARAAATTDRVSVSTTGEQGTEASGRGGVSVSGTGRVVAFASDAPNLVPGDTNGARDVFVRGVADGTTERVSLGEDGRQGNGDSSYPSISSDGNFLVFQSSASNLIAGDTNGASDIFLRDIAGGSTKLISANQSGDLGNGQSEAPSISADGRFVAFDSSATNLVFGDTNGLPDVFVKDLGTGLVDLASVAWDGAQANNGSRAASVATAVDGAVVAFMSAASNLTQEPDLNGADDIFVRDVAAGTTSMVSADPEGHSVEAESTTPSVSADARFVAFDSNGPLFPHVFGFHVYVRELATGHMTIADLQVDGRPSTAYTAHGVLSATGRFVAFISNSRKLVRGDTNHVMDVFIRDLVRGVTRRVSVSSTGEQGNAESSSFDLPAISTTGRAVAYASSATNLVPGDTNGVQDVFVRR